MPTYNEQARVGDSLRKAQDYLGAQPYDSEILVVDDGSEDGTVALVQESFPAVRLVTYRPNRGKGYAVKAGMLAAQGDFRAFYDADASTPIEEVGKLWPLFGAGADIIIGSRSLPTSDVAVRQHRLRETMGRAFNLILKTVLGETFIDTQCGFKAFTAAATGVVFPRQRLDGFSFDAELLYIARKHALRIEEIPVRWINSPHSRVKILTHSTQMFLDLFQIRRHDRRGEYD
ncbi:MAG: glycosyltransferase [Nitrospiraceae bacterium]|nr:glycosyltransferase [Nitrospiraceae bacterium]